MDLKDFKAGSFGKGYQYQYFLPEKINHLFYWTDPGINDLLEKASLKLGELNSFSKLVPDTDMFIKMHIFKEAVVSSRIEGTQTNIEEAIIDEKDINPEKRDDWQEVNNYVKAMNKAIEELKKTDRLEVLEVTRHSNKLRMGHLHGNHFKVKLYGVTASDADIAESCKKLSELGFINYFGKQRFGYDGGNIEQGLRVIHAVSNQQ